MKGLVVNVVQLLLLLSFFFLGSSGAKEGVFSTKIAVSEQSNTEFTVAARISLAEVIANFSGNRAVLRREEVQSALNHAADFVEQYQYNSVSAEGVRPRTLMTPKTKASGKAAFTLAVTFSQEAIEELMQQEAASSIENSTPSETSTMIWLVLDRQGQSEIVGGERQLDLRDRLSEYGLSHGLTLVFPLLDLQDIKALKVADIRGGFSERILAASKRYSADSVVTIVMQEKGGDLWLSSWRQFTKKSVRSFTNTASNADGVINGGVEWLADLTHVARSDISTASTSLVSQTRVWVGRLDSTDKYTRVTRLLSELPGVESVNPAYLSTRGMLFTVTPHIPVTQIQQRLRSISWLQQSPKPDIDANDLSVPENAQLYFDYSG
jgi:hypothetical protein